MVKDYIVDVWEIRKHKLHDSDSGSGLQLHTQSSPGERSGKFSQNAKFGQNEKFSQNGICVKILLGVAKCLVYKVSTIFKELLFMSLYFYFSPFFFPVTL